MDINYEGAFDTYIAFSWNFVAAVPVQKIVFLFKK